MACLICGRSADYDLVRDGETEPAAEVCRPCTEEFLAVDEGNPTCVYCDRNGVYDVRTQKGGGFPGAETEGDTFSTPYESVLCEEHFAGLGDETPAGSPEAADDADVEGESEAEGEGAADDDTDAADESAADAADGDADEADESAAEADTADGEMVDDDAATDADADADESAADADASDDNR